MTDRPTPRRAVFIPVLIGLALVMAACSKQEEAVAPSPQSELLARGQTMAENLCAGCHAIGTEGDSPHAAAKPFRYFSENYEIRDLSEAFAEGIMVGHPDMPDWQFSEADTDALLTYIESIQTDRPI